jgi:hypothetical protein
MMLLAALKLDIPVLLPPLYISGAVYDTTLAELAWEQSTQDQ